MPMPWSAGSNCIAFNKYLSLILNISLEFNNFSEQYLNLKAKVFEVSVIFLPCDEILGIFPFFIYLNLGNGGPQKTHTKWVWGQI